MYLAYRSGILSTESLRVFKSGSNATHGSLLHCPATVSTGHGMRYRTKYLLHIPWTILTYSIFLTYEDKTRFSIVMKPIAKTRHRFMAGRWFICLSDTLAFIQCKGVCHKDIKRLNILVHGEHIIFADSRSSYAFLGGDCSTS
jgi:hypothetical protein